MGPQWNGQLNCVHMAHKEGNLATHETTKHQTALVKTKPDPALSAD